jgi:hypothetical protein
MLMNKTPLIVFFILVCSTLTCGQNWQSLNGGIGYSGVRSMYADSLEDHLYVSGRFSEVDGQPIKGIARWNGSNWDSLQSGIDGMDTVNQFGSFAYDMVRFNGKLYISGGFASLGNVPAASLGTWDESLWDSLPIQPHLSIYCSLGPLFENDGNLYVGGAYDSIAGLAANSISKWDGISWGSLNFPNFFPSPIQFTYSIINSICSYDGKIYAAGLIYSVPIDTVGYILQYDGSAWSTVGGGIKGGGITSILCMAVYHGELYVGGYFTKSAGNVGNNIQKWDGNTWDDVGGGMDIPNGAIRKLIVWHDKLYAIGVFDEAGGIPANKIAVWDGLKWCSLGSTFDNVLSAASLYHDSLFVGGSFLTADGDSVNYVAKWAAGNFTDTCSTIGITDPELLEKEFYFYPNPTENSITINFPFIKLPFIFSIKDFLGRFQKIEIISVQTKSKEFDISEFSSGIYFVTLESESGKLTKKFIKE